MKIHPQLLILLILINSSNTCLSGELKCPMPSGEANGGPPNQYGPYDYTNPEHKAKRIPIVELYHFQPDVEMLIHGTSGPIGGDLSYTLRAIPNHHRALEALANYSVRLNRSTMADINYSVPCFFSRATHFAPFDGMVNAIYAHYLARIGQNQLAQQEIEQALKKNPTNARVNYDVGLAYFYIGNIDKAKEYSQLAKKYGSGAVGLDNLISQSHAKSSIKTEKTK